MSATTGPRPAPPEQTVEGDGPVTSEADKPEGGAFGFDRDPAASGFTLESNPALGGRLVRESELKPASPADGDGLLGFDDDTGASGWGEVGDPSVGGCWAEVTEPTNRKD
jgi:hypothetical protein